MGGYNLLVRYFGVVRCGACCMPHFENNFLPRVFSSPCFARAKAGCYFLLIANNDPISFSSRLPANNTCVSCRF
jgi:hypothetical protein